MTIQEHYSLREELAGNLSEWLKFSLHFFLQGGKGPRSVSADTGQALVAQDPDDKKTEIHIDTQNAKLQDGVVTSGHATGFEIVLHGKLAFSVTGFDIDLTGFNLGTTTDSNQLYTEFYDHMQGALVATGNKYGNDFEVGGGRGKATVDAGSGADVIYIWHQKDVVIDGGKGRDLIDFDSQFGSVTSIGGAATVDLAKGTGINPFGGTMKIANVENVAGAWVASCNFKGDNHDNVLVGSRGTDILMGRGGDDTIKVQLTTVDQARATHADGGKGTDTLSVEMSNIMSTQTGTGSTTNYHNLLDLENQDLNTGTFKGGTYKNFEVYQATTDASYSDFDFAGSSKGETAMGSLGNDNLDGRDGNDVLDGFIGADILTGGSGADHFRYQLLSSSTVDPSGQDTIEDFNHAEHDKIDLSDMHPRLSQNGKYDFIGSKDFDGKGSEVRFEHDGGNTMVMVDDDGDKTADMEIMLVGNINLVKGDFML